MADQFNANDPIFSNFTNIPGFDLEAQVALINKSQLLIDLLDRFKNNDEYGDGEKGTLTYDAAGNMNGYYKEEGEEGKPVIQFHDIGGNDFVRILSHELGHAYDQLVKGTLTGDDKNDPDGFEEIISYEMDESEATATSYIIRQQILANGGPDIKISNKLGINEPGNGQSYLPEMDARFGSINYANLTLDSFWETSKNIANWIWGKNFPLLKPGNTLNRWEKALSEVFGDDIPGFLQTNVRTFKSARINDDGKYEFIFIEAQGANAGQEIKYVFGSNSSSGDDQANLLVVGDTDHALLGGSGDDVLVGNWTREGAEDTEGDLMDGGAGNDTFYTGKGYDILRGGTGNDTFIIQGTDTDYDVFYGGDGTDTIQGADKAGDLDDTIRVNSLSLAENSIEIIDGGGGVNVIAGTDGDNTIDLTGIQVSHINRIEGGYSCVEM